MAMKASSQAIRDMAKTIRETIKDIEHISSGIRNGVRATENWNDSKAAEFNQIMQRIARLTEKPVSTLNAACPKLEQLAQAVDQYNGVNMGG